MLNFKGLVYVKHGRVGTRGEGPDYYLQTTEGDYLLQYQPRMQWQPDYQLEFFCRRMVEVQGVLQTARVIDVSRIVEILAEHLPVKRPPGAPELGQPVSIHVGQSAAFPEVTLSVLGVPEDSRCPLGRVCLWEGHAVVSLQLEPAGGTVHPFKLTLRSGYPDLAETTVAGYRVKLVQLEPVRQPSADELTPQYTATLVVSAEPSSYNERLDVDEA